MVGKICMSQDKIIKVIKVEEMKIYGYNIQTEELETISAHETLLFPKDELLKSIISSDKMRFLLAKNISQNQKELSANLGCSVRNVIRLKQKYNDV